MKKISFKKITITKLNNQEKAAVNGGRDYFKREGSWVPPCTVLDSQDFPCNLDNHI